MVNPLKNYEFREIRYKPKEYQKLMNALESNDKEEVLNIVFAIYLRKHFL